MPGVPAHCDVCGLTFISNAIWIENGSSITLAGNIVRCPNGHRARVIDGTFDFLGNAINVRSAPPRTMNILAVLQGALNAAQSGKGEDEVVDQLREASPEFATLAQAAVKRGGISFLIFLLVYLLTTCSANINQTLDWNRLIDQAHQYLVVDGDESEQSEESRSQPKQTQELSRQQLRQQERQSKKQQKPPERPPRTPKPRPKR